MLNEICSKWVISNEHNTNANYLTLLDQILEQIALSVKSFPLENMH